MPNETFEIEQVWLGLNPYVLIEAELDPEDGDLVLKIKSGGGAAEEIYALPLMMVAGAETSPLHQQFRDALADAKGEQARDAINGLAERIGLRL